MHAKLVGSARMGLHLEPRQRLSGLVDDPIVGDGVIGAFLPVPGDAHPVAIRCLLLHEPVRYLAFAPFRHALDQRPVGLLRLAGTKRLGELHGREPCPGNDQHAAGVAIEPVHQSWLLTLPVAPRLEHRIDAPGDTGAALHGESGRLVEDEHLVVLVEQHPGQQFAVALPAHRLRGQRRATLAVHVERRNAHGLTRLKPRVGLGAAAIDPHLAGAQQLLQVAEAETRIVGLEPAVEPHAAFVLADLDLLYACHRPSDRSRAGNSISRPHARATIRQTAPGWRRPRFPPHRARPNSAPRVPKAPRSRARRRRRS